MTLPAFLFGSLISIFIGSLFHLIAGGNFRKFVLFIFFAWFGFWLGYYLSNRIAFNIWQLGLFDMGFCVLGSILTLLFIYWIDKGSQEAPADENHKEE
ncbi:MAG: hypothetical protein GYA52_06585 [Chloroflexi bacterium]|jgi:hypothetical protein|nr:hypothetical protein [Chloroflexota bacterium]